MIFYKVIGLFIYLIICLCSCASFEIEKKFFMLIESKKSCAIVICTQLKGVPYTIADNVAH